MARAHADGPRRRRPAPAAADRPRVVAAACAAALALALAVLLHESLFLGKGLVPADGVLRFPPWAATWRVGPSNALLSDQYLVFLPQRQFVHDEVRAGRFPLWNPRLAGGLPTLASMQTATLYPINLLLSPVHPFTAAGLAAFVKLFCAGAFTALYVRGLGVAPVAALLAGLVYALSGFMIAWLGHPHVNGAVLLPLLLYLVDRQLERPPGLRHAVGLALAMGALVLGGHPPTAVHVTLIVTAYAVLRLAERGRPRRTARALVLGGALAAGVLVAAVQVLPYLEYHRESSSALASARLDRASTHLGATTLLHFLLPHLFGGPVAGFESLPSALGIALRPADNFNERAGYVGVLALFLAALAVGVRRCRFTWLHAGLAVVCSLIVYGVPPWPSIMRALPVLADINHQRLLLGVDWGLAVLAGLGADTLVRGAARSRCRVVALAFVVAVVAVLAVLWGVIGPALGRLDAAAREFVSGQLYLVAAALAVALVVTLPRLPRAWAPIVCAGGVALELVWLGLGYNPAIPRDRYYPSTEAIRFLRADTSVFRVLGLSTVLIPDTASVYGLHDARGLDFMSVRRYEELVTGRAGDFWFYLGAADLPRAFPLLNVKYVLLRDRPAPSGDFDLVYDKEIAILRNRHLRERALIVFDHRVESDPAEALRQVRAPGFDPGRTLLLEETPEPAAGGADPAIGEAAAHIVSYEADRVVVEARLPRPGFLLLLDNHFPGWKAYVGDEERRIYRADHAFRAVPLAAGRWTVRFEYRPASFRVGAAVSLSALGALVALWAVAPRIERS